MHIHFVGIGGIGMSALARLYQRQGHEVTGSDFEDSKLLENLRDEGIGVFIGHTAAQIAPDTDVVIHSEAVPVDNLELSAARERGISMKTYFEALGEWTRDKKTICIAGTHGKTTTTALIACLLLQSYRDPTVVIGTQMKELEGKNMRLGGSEYMVVEACEYRRSFLHLQPTGVVLTNIELDHVDYYRDLDDYLSAFREFVMKIPADGFLVANGDDENVRLVAQSAICEVLWYSKDSTHLEKLELKVPGSHNRMNAMAAYTTGLYLKIEEEMMLEALNSFEGTWRRFEYKGSFNGADIYDDYAHHPTEIQATLQAAREKYPDHRLIAVYQSHQHSRARYFLGEFGPAFKQADEVIIPNIYKVRDSEEDIQAVSAEKMVHEIQKTHPNVRYGNGFENTVAYLKKTLQPNDLVLVMGAGDVWKVAEELIA